jgi:hypothetical protein
MVSATGYWTALEWYLMCSARLRLRLRRHRMRPLPQDSRQHRMRLQHQDSQQHRRHQLRRAFLPCPELQQHLVDQPGPGSAQPLS